MPIRFNHRELVAIASKNKEEYDKQGVLSLREVEDKIFHKADKFTDRLFRLKGNLLFYLKTKDPISEVSGLIVLDQCNIAATATNRKFSFTIDSKHCDDVKYELAAESREDLVDWINKIDNARYESVSKKLMQLRTDIIKLSGEDPLPDYPPIENQTVGEDPPLSEILQSTKTKFDNSTPVMEICLACTNLSTLQDQSKPTLMVKIFVMLPSEKSWVRHSQTELCEDSKEPFFLKTVVFDSKFSTSTQLKFILYDVRSRSRNLVVALGQAVCSIQEVQQAQGWRLTLNLRNLESKEEIGNMILQGWRRKSENSFARRQNSVDFIRGYGSRGSLSHYPSTYVGQVCERSFHFPTKENGDVKFQELMGESMISFKLTSQLLNLYIQEEKEVVLELHKLGKLKGPLDNVKNKQQNGHFDLVSLYSESLSELSNYKGRNYKRSSEKCSKELEFVTTNLHIQRTRVIEQDERDYCYDVITFGCPAAHSMKFRHGGLHRLLPATGDFKRSDTMSVTDNEILIAGSKAKNVKSVVNETQREIIKSCNEIGSLDTENLKTVSNLLSNKVAELINLASSKFVQDAEEQLASARGPSKASSSPNDETSKAEWRWNGIEYQEVDPTDQSLINVQEDHDCGLRDELAKFMSLINLATQDDTFLGPDSLDEAAKKLCKVVKSFTRKLNVIMRFILLKTNNHFNSYIKDLRYRRDIVFSQVISPVLAGFNVKLSENLQNEVFMDQISKIGVLVSFESLITPYGDELGMMEDALVAYKDLENVYFEFVCNNSPQCFPSLQGIREEVIVSIPLHKENFQKLPNNLQKGERIKIIPILFNVGINEHATIAERFGDMSIQETINSENLNKLYNYYEKFSTYYPDWVGTLSKKMISLPMLMASLQVVVNSKKSKNTEIFCLFEEICQRMNGIRLTSCKSAKDRTAMAVTLEAVRILEREHNLPLQLFAKTLNTMRSQGTRLINSLKNVGIPKYAFNMMQVRAYPSIYRPPEGTYGKNVQN